MLTDAGTALLNGRYLVQGLLGEGATSMVLSVLDRQQGVPRAIKLLHREASEPLLRAEFGRLSRMAHPRLVRVHDLDRLQQPLAAFDLTVEAGRLFLVMDLVQGPSPVEHLESVLPQDRDRLLRGIAADLALALAHVHGHGLVHHDVKPDNLLIDEQGRAVLLDLGLATIERRGGMAGRGTLPYMAPEGIVGGGDHRVDLYGMGATLFHLATGRSPFLGSGTDLVRRILEQEAQLPAVSWLSGELARLILHLLHKDPLRRPGSARTVLAELHRMAGEHEKVAELVATRELLPPGFVGRDAALSRLMVLDVEHSTVVLVVAESGMGKSRLIQEAVTRQRIGAAAGRYPARELLAGDLREVLGSTAGGASSPAVGRWLRGEESGSPQGLALQMVERLEQRARGGALWIHLQHVDADPLARGLLEVILSDEGTAPMLVVAETHPHGPLLDQLGHHPRLVRIDLEPLEAGQTAWLVASMLGLSEPPDELGGRIHQLSGGNPALAVELTRLYNDRGEEGLDLGRVGSLGEVLSRERGWLAADHRAVMDALAVWGEPATGDELAALTARSSEQVWDVVHQLARQGRVLVGPDQVRLPGAAHVTAWRRALGEGPDARVLHQRAADLLDPASPGPRLAWHLLVAGRPQATAVALGVARELVGVHDTTSAVPLLERVVSQGPPDLREEAVPLLAQLYISTGRYEEALELLEGDRHQLLRAELLQKRGDYGQAEELLQRLIPTLSVDTERRKAAALLARLMLGQGRPAEALEVAQAHQPDEGVDPALQEASGLARVYLGDLEGADRIFAEGERALGAAGDERQLARFFDFRGMVAFFGGHHQRAAALYGKALELAERAGDVHGGTTYRANLGAVELQLGRLGAALVHFTRAGRDLARLARNTELASTLCNLANLFTLLGDLDAAEGIVQRARTEADRLDSRHTAGFVAMLEGDLLRRGHGRAGEAEKLGGAEDRYRLALATFGQVGAAREQVDCRLALVEVLVLGGRAEESRRMLEELWAEHPDRRGEVAMGWVRLDLAHEGESLPEGIEQVLASHCGALEEQGARKDLWRAGALLGALLAHRGRRGAARQVLRRAKITLEEIVSETPEVYREQMARDPDAGQLAAEWRQLLEGQEEALPAPASSTSAVLYDRRWVRRILTLNKRLNSELRLPRLLELIMDTAIELTEAERGFLLLRGDEGELSIKVARNIDQRSLDGDELSLSRSIAEQATLKGEPVVAIDAAEDQRFQEALSVSDLRLRSVLAVPLLLKGRAVGTIYVDHRLRQGAFGEEEVSLMQDIAEQAAIAMENARLLTENQGKAEEIERLNCELQRKVDSQQQELLQAREELRSSRKALKLRYDYGNIIGQTPKMLEMFQLLDRVTETDLPVVVQGDSGTGKELVARAIHHNGPRSSGTFVGENCAAIPETLLESILFGHVKGAFTGAERDRKGLFEVASGGTLFLDEVGEMSPAMQTKLLRVLQDGELRRVGGTQIITTDVRVIAASNRDLSQLVKEGRFREDLFYRLNVIQIRIPPLRDRRGDIPLLVEHFLVKHSKQVERRVSPDAMALLMGYPWPGNVRELENEVMRAAALGDALLGPDDLSPQIAAAVPLVLSDPDDLDLRARVEHLERELIQRAIRKTGGNHTQSAKMLGLSRYGLLKKLQRYGFAPRAKK